MRGCRCSPVGPRRAPDPPAEWLRETRTRRAKASLSGTPGPFVSSSNYLYSLKTRPTTRWKVVRPWPDQLDRRRRLCNKETDYSENSIDQCWIQQRRKYMYMWMYICMFTTLFLIAGQNDKLWPCVHSHLKDCIQLLWWWSHHAWAYWGVYDFFFLCTSLVMSVFVYFERSTQERTLTQEKTPTQEKKSKINYL